MKLTSMKLSRTKRAEVVATEPEGDGGPLYPWGLGLHLDNETLEKLGLELPEVGKSLMLVARVNVTGISSHESTDGSKKRSDRSASLQITDLAIEADQGEGHAAKLYDKG